ncbi:hypothetical protein LTR10_014263 [Elasticomyces elasticus]|uniref:SnoaL-like domain-containing protein n=1 Tax=Exophiala sideris TaxID=1016849 RepID=A0ABR0JIK9_9EURO|nr:hypothetical protein LTR10_014263 [Elasticomyces elasticus]KAK5034303.1 hypothetical protein LTS07_003223 [Exophiala sideris]KAK5042600.1 hypothetical protein LTR13_001447 [Exophiala sideris]KAK5065682.1 hypothetical protein LTR69_003231 [Exophiala sideris]KAK5185860.1 hypothetical protein LTR44_001909 [Eurotiomycetes sp. CCFEE 6388]
MDRLLEKEAIVETIHLVARALDDLDTKLLQGQFLAGHDIALDVSGHLKELPLQHILPEELSRQMYTVLAGFDATHHVITNEVVKFGEGQESLSKAHATVYFSAYHCLQDKEGLIKSVFARGRWEIEVEKHSDRWVITSLAIIRTVPSEPAELNLYIVAKMRVEAGDGRVLKQ